MNSTVTLRETDIDQLFIDGLRSFNIRTVEQLLIVRRSDRRKRILSRALNMPLSDLNMILNRLAEAYPHLVTRPPLFKRRPLGLRLSAGNKRVTT